MSYLLWHLASLILGRPDRVRCEPGWYVEGVRPSGATACVEAPKGNGADECVAGGVCGGWAAQRRVEMHVWCGGKRPSVVSEREVGCR